MSRMVLVPVHVHHSYTFHRQSSYVETFHADPTKLDEPYCSREKGLPTQSLARWLTDPQVRHLVSLPTQSLK
jgi:hypothetical protein